MEDVETYDMNVRDAGVLFYAKVIEDYEPPTEVRWMMVKLSTPILLSLSLSVSLSLWPALSAAILFFCWRFCRYVETPTEICHAYAHPRRQQHQQRCGYGPLPPPLPFLPSPLSLPLSR